MDIGNDERLSGNFVEQSAVCLSRPATAEALRPKRDPRVSQPLCSMTSSVMKRFRRMTIRLYDRPPMTEREQCLVDMPRVYHIILI